MKLRSPQEVRKIGILFCCVGVMNVVVALVNWRVGREGTSMVVFWLALSVVWFSLGATYMRRARRGIAAGQHEV